MKYVVKVTDKCFEVEIEDIHARPVIAYVDGQEFRVTLEEGARPVMKKGAQEIKPVAMPNYLSDSATSTSELTAPLPGTVIEIFVKPGEHIETGHVILIIEAMKMKNSIRSTRSGTVTEVLVGAGQTVTHKQVLVKFGD